MDVLNRETLILLGIAILIINIIAAAFLKRRFRAFSAIVATAACIIVIVGIVQVTLTPATAQSAFGSGNFGNGVSSNSNANTGSFTNISNSNGANGNVANTANNTAGVTAANGAAEANTPANGAAGSSGGVGGSGRQLPSALQTSIAQGTIPAPMQTRMAAQGAGSPPNGQGANLPNTSGTAEATSASTTAANSAGPVGGTTGGSGTGSGSSGASSTGGATNRTGTATNVSPLVTLLIIARRYIPFVTIAGGLLVLFAGMLYYASERQRETFRRRGSLGLLNIIIGALIVATMVGLPMVTTQAAGSTHAAALAITATSGPAPTREGLASATPTVQTNISTTNTPLPSLTPVLTETPIVLSTSVAYTHVEATTVTNCSVSALSGLNLRAEPATNQMAIGKVLAGSLMKVTGKSADGQWWRVISTENVEGWVSAGYVTPYSGCTADSVPVIATATPQP